LLKEELKVLGRQNNCGNKFLSLIKIINPECDYIAVKRKGLYCNRCKYGDW